MDDLLNNLRLIAINLGPNRMVGAWVLQDEINAACDRIKELEAALAAQSGEELDKWRWQRACQWYNEDPLLRDSPAYEYRRLVMAGITLRCRA